MSGGLVLGASSEADIPAITTIYAHAVLDGTASFEIEPPSEAAMAERRRARAAGGFPWLVAERDGRVLGYAYAGLYRPRPAYRWTVEDSVYAARGEGVGRALLGRLIADSEAAGFRPMVAVIGDAASQASIGLHRALGFREAGRFEGIGFKHGRWLDSVLMQRPLGEGRESPPLSDGRDHAGATAS